MMFDVELAKRFYIELDRGNRDNIEQAYYDYRGYVRNIEALDYYIPINNFHRNKVEELWNEWKAKNSVG